jgi:hypothetical protein
MGEFKDNQPLTLGMVVVRLMEVEWTVGWWLDNQGAPVIAAAANPLKPKPWDGVEMVGLSVARAIDYLLT